MKLKVFLAAAGLILFLGSDMEVMANANFTADVFGGARHSYLVDHEGTAYGWGENGYFQLGSKESSATVRYPESIWFKDNSIADNIRMFSSSKSNFFTLAMMDDGTLRFWGHIFSYDGGLGGYWKDTDYSNYITIQNQDGTPFMDASMISSGDTHMTALRKDGTVWTWGQNGFGQLGNGKTDHTPYPQQVVMQDGSPLTDIISISSGAWHTLALKQDGTVYGWGWNRNKQLGVTPQNISAYAIPILTSDQRVLSDIIGIEAGGEHSLVLTNKNQVMAWGHNNYGQLGNGNTTSQPYPVLVQDENNQPLSNIKTLKTSGYSSYALTSDSEILGWGRNQFGQLGNGILTEIVRIPGYVKKADNLTLSNVYSFSAGWQHVLAIQKDGALWGWGSNVGNTLGTEEENGGGVPLAKRVLKQAEVPFSTVVEANTSKEEVKNATVTIKNNKALLKWENPNSTVKYVEIYKDGVYLGTSPTTIYIDEIIETGSSHTYTLKAVDALGNKTDGKHVEMKHVQPVQMIEVKTDINSPQPVKSSIFIEAHAEGGYERLYKFWVLENGTWKILQDYSEADSVIWTPLLEGKYKISVHVKDKRSAKSYDDYRAFEYTIESESVLLNSFTSQLPSPRAVYSSIPLSVSATGGSEKLFKFFAYHNGVWTVLQDYSKSPTLKWIPKIPGDYKLVVHAKDRNSPKSYDSYKTLMFKVVNGPVMQSLSTSAASPQFLGKTIQIKAAAAGGTEKLYKFWIYDGNEWRVLRDYSSLSSYDWKPNIKGTYKISVHVKDRYSTRTYDSYKALNYTIK